MTRREFVRRLGATTAAAAGGALLNVLGGGACRPRGRRPDIVLFLADDLGYGDLGCQGHPFMRTPRIDRFAAEGMRFTDCHSGGTVCSPSRAAILTGRNPYRSGLYYIVGGGAHLRREEISVARLLQDQGYDTCFVGKWHLSRFHTRRETQPSPGDHGFDHWFATEVNAFEGPKNPRKFVRNGRAVGEVSGWYCDVIVREALEWLADRPDPERPFFLVVASHEPHTPLDPPARFSDPYVDPEIDRLERRIGYGGVARPEKDITPLKKHYYGTVTQLDEAFGRLLDGMDGLMEGRNTLTIFTSDNGPEAPVNREESLGEWEDPSRDRCFGSPGPLRGMKRFPYEGGHRVPGIFRWPGRIPPGTISREVINGTDFLPTFCELAGAPVPSDRAIDGVSITGAFREEPIVRERPLCWFFPAHEDTWFRMPNMALREGDDVLIGTFRRKREDERIMDWIKSTRLESFELYRLSDDPGQSRDLSRSQPERTAELAERMRRLWREIQSEGPVWPDWTMT